MVWCGVVWCGVVWCGVVWCGVVWCGVVWCGVVWCGVVWCGVVWRVVRCGAARCSVCGALRGVQHCALSCGAVVVRMRAGPGVVAAPCHVVRHSSPRRVTVCHPVLRCGVVLCGLVWSATTKCGTEGSCHSPGVSFASLLFLRILLPTCSVLSISFGLVRAPDCKARRWLQRRLLQIT